SSRRRHTRSDRDWSSDVCSSDLRALARRLGTAAVHVRSDAVRKHLVRVPLDERAGSAAYTADMTARTYARLLEIGVPLADAGFTALLDAKYDRAAQRSAAVAAAA